MRTLMFDFNKQYALLNYKEVLHWYNLPFYKKWIIKRPLNHYIEIKNN